MGKKARNPEEELKRVYDSLAESITEETEDEIVEDVASAGENVDILAEEVRSILMEKVQTHKKHRLEVARQTYEQKQKELDSVDSVLPTSAEERRLLLQWVFERSQYGEALLTAQHREFKSLDDEDIVGYLKQLAALGVLDEYKES